MPDINLPVRWSADGSFDKAFDELEKELEDVVRGLTVEVWNSILYRTPQFFGRMAASWSYSLDYPAFWDRSNMVAVGDTEEPGAVKSRGHLEAIAVARASSAGIDTRFRLGDEVFIANGVDHGEGPYSGAIEAGDVMLRPINRPGRPVTRTMDFIQSRYGNDSGISANAAIRLKGLKLAVEAR